jgi:hypothetical protein
MYSITQDVLNFASSEVKVSDVSHQIFSPGLIMDHAFHRRCAQPSEK